MAVFSEAGNSAWYLGFNGANIWVEKGFSPDGTIPPGRISCTESEHVASGPWTTLVNGVIVIGTPPSSAPAYVPASLIRTRLQAAGKWDAAVAAMTPGQMAWFCTLELGVLPDDATALALLNGIGADPSVILAPPSSG
jgi:hypothetical protein